jgi:hypothetical protein
VRAVFAAKKSSGVATIRRATAGRIADATVAIDRFLNNHPEIQVGEIARTHWNITQARQQDGTDVSVPDNAKWHI